MADVEFTLNLTPERCALWDANDPKERERNRRAFHREAVEFARTIGATKAFIRGAHGVLLEKVKVPR